MINKNKYNLMVKTKEIIETWLTTVTAKKEKGSYRKAAEILGISVNTVKKHVLEYRRLKDKADKNPKDRSAVEQLLNFLENGFQRKKRNYERPRRTKELAEFIHRCLNINVYNEDQTGWTKQNLSGRQMHIRALKEGFDVDYKTFMRFKKEILDERLKLLGKTDKENSRVYTEQNYYPGEIVEFDWGEVHINLKGKYTKAYAAVFTMPYSNFRIAFLYAAQDAESFIDAHNRFFAITGATPYIMVYDNMAIVVKNFGPKRKKELTDLAKQMSHMHEYAIRLTNAHAGNEKSHVERAVSWMRGVGFKWRIDFDSIEEADEYLQKEIRSYYESPIEVSKEQIEKFKEDISALKCPFTTKFEVSKFYRRKVSSLSTVVLEKIKYSVPEELKGQIVDLKVTGSELRIFHEGKLAAQHVITGQNSLDIRHLGNYFKENPGAIRRSDFYKWCPAAQKINVEFFNGDFTILGAFLAENRDTDFSLFPIRAKEFMAHYSKEHSQTENNEDSTNKEGGEQSNEPSEEFKKRMEEYNDLFIK